MPVSKEVIAIIKTFCSDGAKALEQSAFSGGKLEVPMWYIRSMFKTLFLQDAKTSLEPATTWAQNELSFIKNTDLVDHDFDYSDFPPKKPYTIRAGKVAAVDKEVAKDIMLRAVPLKWNIVSTTFADWQTNYNSVGETFYW